MAPMGQCRVCKEQPAKYKCPKCITPYCSLTCWRTHQQNPCSPPVPPAPNSTSSTPPPEVSNSEENRTSKQCESPDKVPEEKLALLGQSEALRSMLGNRHLRDMLQNLCEVQDPVKELEAAMHEPIFLECAQECLNIVKGGLDGASVCLE